MLWIHGVWLVELTYLIFFSFFLDVQMQGKLLYLEVRISFFFLLIFLFCCILNRGSVGPEE